MSFIPHIFQNFFLACRIKAADLLPNFAPLANPPRRNGKRPATFQQFFKQQPGQQGFSAFRLCKRKQKGLLRPRHSSRDKGLDGERSQGEWDSPTAQHFSSQSANIVFFFLSSLRPRPASPAAAPATSICARGRPRRFSSSQTSASFFSTPALRTCQDPRPATAASN